MLASSKPSNRVSEAFCYICRGVLIEPVTLPCFHVFCYTCFEQSMQETSYSCPLCRKRISNWVRSVKKTNQLVNTTLWNQIQEQFKEQVRLKLNKEDDGLDIRMQEEYSRFEATSKPGEIAQEFSKLLNDFRNESERLRQAEELASEVLIAKLKEEEEQRLQSVQRDNIMRILEDRKLAMKIQEEINKEIPGTSKSSSITKSSSDKKVTRPQDKNVKKPQKGLIDEFLKGFSGSDKKKGNSTIIAAEETGSGERTDDRSTSTDSLDSITLETNHFKPIRKVKRTPPKSYPEGDQVEISLTKVMPLKLTFNSCTEPPSSSGRSIIEGVNIHSTHSAFVDTNTSTSAGDNYESPSKRLRISSEEPGSGVLKDITLEENNESSSVNAGQSEETATKKTLSLGKKSDQENFMSPCKIAKITRVSEEENEEFETQDYLNPEPSIEEKIIEEQRRIEKIILQEKLDRELALKLSREWESEGKTKPQTRSAIKRKKTHENKKNQPTLFESIASRTRNQKK